MKADLSATAPGAARVWTRITPTDRCRPAGDTRAKWQLLDLFSDSRLPFRAKITWTAGDEGGMEMFLDVPRHTRVAIAAYEITVYGANDSDAENKVHCTLSEVAGPFTSQNQWTVEGVGNDGPQLVDIPPFAIGFRVDLEDFSAYSLTPIRLDDGYKQPRLRINADAQPAWLPLGAARSLYVGPPTGKQFRTTFILSV